MCSSDLAGKRALIAGAGQGIGRATALLLADAGARVGCMELDEGRRAAIVMEVEAAGASAIGLGGDLRHRADVEAAVASTVEAFGGLDVAIDIVGEARWNPVLRQTDADWEESFALVLRHVFFLFQAAGARMAEQRGGALVAVASVSGLFAAPFHAAYGAAKAGLISLVKLARDFFSASATFFRMRRGHCGQRDRARRRRTPHLRCYWCPSSRPRTARR